MFVIIPQLCAWTTTARSELNTDAHLQTVVPIYNGQFGS